MDREVRYCTAEDGVRIAYCVEGEGPALLWCPIFVESFSLHHLHPPYLALLQELGRGRQLVCYDMRGVGLSQRDVTDFSNRALVRDIEAVVTAARLKRFALWGNTTSGARAITYAVENPDRLTHLVLWETVAEPSAFMAFESAKALAEFAKANWSSAVYAITGLGLSAGATGPGREALAFDEMQQLGRMYEQSADGQVVASMTLEAYESSDVRSILQRVRTPTLILHVVGDTFIPFEAARDMAEQINEATLVPLRNLSFQEPELLSLIDRFLPAVRASAGKSKEEGPFRTVLFTDIVGHTEMMSRLGDDRGREVLREHERITREVLKAHGGTEVKTMGDGFMASFGSVTKAVECAVALQKAMDARNRGVGAEQLPDDVANTDDATAVAQPLRASAPAQTPPEPLHVRVGLNAGEPIEEDGDLFGATVILASRIAAKAEGGEILVADTVRGLCSGKGFLFADRGEFVAKGFEEPVRVYEVRWRK